MNGFECSHCNRKKSLMVSFVLPRAHAEILFLVCIACHPSPSRPLPPPPRRELSLFPQSLRADRTFLSEQRRSMACEEERAKYLRQGDISDFDILVRPFVEELDRADFVGDFLGQHLVAARVLDLDLAIVGHDCGRKRTILDGRFSLNEMLLVRRGMGDVVGFCAELCVWN